MDWDITEAGIGEAHAGGLVADARVWSPAGDCAPGEIHAVDLLISYKEEIDLGFFPFVYRYLALSQTGD